MTVFLNFFLIKWLTWSGKSCRDDSFTMSSSRALQRFTKNYKLTIVNSKNLILIWSTLVSLDLHDLVISLKLNDFQYDRASMQNCLKMEMSLLEFIIGKIIQKKKIMMQGRCICWNQLFALKCIKLIKTALAYHQFCWCFHLHHFIEN